MKNKNLVSYVLVIFGLVVISGIGISFASFAVNLQSSGSGGSVNQTTSTIGNVTLTSSSVGVASSANKLDFPGGYGVVGQKVVTSNTDTTNGYTATFTVNGTIVNNTSNTLNWTLYESSTSNTTPLSGCSLQTPVVSGVKRYYYTGCTVATNIKTTTVKSGTAVNGTTNINATGEILSAPKSGSTQSTTYYYLVVEYPNASSSQSSSNKTITYSLTGTTATSLAKS